jgi:hypothetical protein
MYEQLIREVTGCSAEDAPLIEDLMRHEVFHSTLDWQSRDLLAAGAREAASLLPAVRAELLALSDRLCQETRNTQVHPIEYLVGRAGPARGAPTRGTRRSR